MHSVYIPVWKAWTVLVCLFCFCCCLFVCLFVFYSFLFSFFSFSFFLCLFVCFGGVGGMGVGGGVSVIFSACHGFAWTLRCDPLTHWPINKQVFWRVWSDHLKSHEGITYCTRFLTDLFQLEVYTSCKQDSRDTVNLQIRCTSCIAIYVGFFSFSFQ